MATAAERIRVPWAVPRPALRAAASLTAILLPVVLVVASWAGASAALSLSLGWLVAMAPASALPRA